MKTKSLSQMSDISSAIEYLEVARQRALAAGEASMAGLIGAVCQKMSVLKTSSVVNREKA